MYDQNENKLETKKTKIDHSNLKMFSLLPFIKPIAYSTLPNDYIQYFM